jgi:hypothetical protein
MTHAGEFLHLDGNDCNQLLQEVQQNLFVWARANGVENVAAGPPHVIGVTLTLPVSGPQRIYVYEVADADLFAGNLRELPVTVPLPPHLARHFTPLRTHPVDQFCDPTMALAGDADRPAARPAAGKKTSP